MPLLVLWLLFVLLLVLAPLGYGWGHRGWGPPRPRVLRRRAAAVPADVQTWGVLADLVWIAMLVAVGWVVVALVL